MSFRSGRRDCVVYVGDLPNDVHEREVEDLFYKYGTLRRVDVKVHGRNGAYAFIEFDDPRDAYDAVRGRDGARFGRNRIRVEVARGSTGPPSAPPNWRDKGTGFRIIVDGLPRSASWQDLKDMFRSVEAPIYTNVYSDSRGVFGVVEYNSHRELRSIMREMRGIRFQNKFCDPTPVKLVDDTDPDKKSLDVSPAGSPERERRRDRDDGRDDGRSRGRDREGGDEERDRDGRDHKDRDRAGSVGAEGSDGEEEGDRKSEPAADEGDRRDDSRSPEPADPPPRERSRSP